MTAIPAPASVGLPGARASAWTLRLVAFSALALFCALHWARIVRPGEAADLIAMFLLTGFAGLLVAAAIPIERRATRWAAVAGTIVVALILAFLLAGMPAWYLKPARWDELVVDLGNGIATLSSVRMPYSGNDAWVRIVLLAGGGAFLLAAAIIALAPRPWTFGAAVTLSIMYVTAIVEHRPAHPYLDGALFALLLAGMLWGERLSGREAPLALGLALAATIGSVVLAPHLDSTKPWVDYEAIAESLQGKSTTFSWNHSYAPLDWPRDGLEVARVRARGDLYLKTANLEDFDGREWIQAKGVLSNGDDTEFSARHTGWTQTIHVEVKGLKSREFLTAGTTTFVTRSSKDVDEATPGTFAATGKPLTRGDGYDAVVYVPKPSEIDMKAAGVDYPYFAVAKLGFTLAARGSGARVDVHVAPWGSKASSTAQSSLGFQRLDVDAVMAGSPYAREWRLAQQVKAASLDPYQYVRNVIARVQRGARYTEAPPEPGALEPLDAFLFRDHAGYCQHFAGATALLLRMGGVPARVVAGFSPGSRDGADHIIRDVDAHSWVEAYFPHIGWVTFDPTPGDSPARSQQTDTLVVRPSTPTTRERSSAASDRTSDPSAGGAADVGDEQGTSTTPIVVAVVVAALLAAALATLVVRRRRTLARSDDPMVEELRLALARSGRPLAPDLTLHKVERLMAGSDGALGYVRALRVARYGAGGPPPTPGQRRALRRELAAGLGIRGRLRALWALPPRSAELREALRPRRRRSYT